jgi:hypothetical protein
MLSSAPFPPKTKLADDDTDVNAAQVAKTGSTI